MNKQKNYTIHASPQGYEILAEGKALSTPLGRPIILPTKALANAVAGEWQNIRPSPSPFRERGGERAPSSAVPDPLLNPLPEGRGNRKHDMPFTQFACIAIDRVADHRAEIEAEIIAYGETDLVSYRSDIPQLAHEQEQAFKPLLAALKLRYGITFTLTHGLMPVTQPAGNQAKWRAIIGHFDDWRLAALAVLVKSLGSLVLARAMLENDISAEDAFRLSQLEETYETSRWGRDEEKETRRLAIMSEINSVAAFISLL